MIALLRYAVLKSSRDHLLFALLFAPAVLLAAPILGVGVAAIVKGAPAYPMTLDAPPDSLARITGQICCAAAAVVAGAGGFWIFRREVAAHAIGSFVMAAPPRVVIFAAATFGAIAGIGSFLIGSIAIALLTAAPPEPVAPLFLAAILGSGFSGAAGAAMVAISAEATMLAPVYAVSAAVAALLLDRPGTLSVAVALSGTLLAFATGSLLMRKRCAI